MAQLTRAQMEQVIRGGGSVSIGGRVINRLDQLPSAVQLAGEDTERLTAAIDDLDVQIAALQEQRKEAVAAKANAEKAAKAAEKDAKTAGNGEGNKP